MGRGALLAIVLCAAACGSSGGGSAPPVTDAGGGGVVLPPDGGAPDAGPPDAGPPDAGPLGGGDWRQYRYDARGGSDNPGVFAAAEVPNLAEVWRAPVELGQYVYTQAVVAEGLVVYTTA